MRILHAIHDFLPAHQAGSEIYALELCRELAHRHDVSVLCAEYDPGRAHGSITRRRFEGLPVYEIVNNWAFASFEETYASETIGTAMDRVLEETRPDILHIHSLLNLSFELPDLARRRGASCVATLHDHTLMCPSGGQRIHTPEQHLCETIDVERCSRCFRSTAFHGQMAANAVREGESAIARAARSILGRLRGPADAPWPPVSPAQISSRLQAIGRVAERVDVFVAPSASLAAEVARFGVPEDKVRVLDYGFVPFPPAPRKKRVPGRLRIGFVGTLVWHKGVHVLVDAVSRLDPARYELLLHGREDWFPEYVAGLKKAARGLPVRFLGAFEHERASESYAAMDVLVVPSIWLENSPLVIHEAFMAGIPVVGARIGGIPGLVTHGVNGLLYEPRSAAALSEALASLIEHPERLDEMSRRLPAVTPMNAHAREWEVLYREVQGRAG